MERWVVALLISIAAPVCCQAGPNLFSVNIWSQNKSLALSRTSAVASDLLFARSSTLDVAQPIEAKNAATEPVTGMLVGKSVVRLGPGDRAISLQPVFGTVNGLQLSMGF
ncbi:MAG: hypothetical protein QOG67_3823 [Verrucomicrobiota bacterium]